MTRCGRSWVEPWVDLFRKHGVGAAIVDSFWRRAGEPGVHLGCRRGAVRRADDAHSARAWLAEQPFVDDNRIAVMGMSNGGRTVLAALRTTLSHPTLFAAGIALYPGCQSDVDGSFTRAAARPHRAGRRGNAGPVLRGDEAPSTRDGPELTVVYPHTPHTFDMSSLTAASWDAARLRPRRGGRREAAGRRVPDRSR